MKIFSSRDPLGKLNVGVQCTPENGIQSVSIQASSSKFASVSVQIKNRGQLSVVPPGLPFLFSCPCGKSFQPPWSLRVQASTSTKLRRRRQPAMRDILGFQNSAMGREFSVALPTLPSGLRTTKTTVASHRLFPNWGNRRRCRRT